MAVYELLKIAREVPPIRRHDNSFQVKLDAVIKAFKCFTKQPAAGRHRASRQCHIVVAVLSGYLRLSRSARV